MQQRPVNRPEAGAPPVIGARRQRRRLLRLAIARGASTLYVVAESKPMVRIDGEIGSLEAERPLSGSEVESLLHEWANDQSRADPPEGPGLESIRDVPDVGRVRCLSFRDHRGPGGIFTLIPTARSADQLALA
jgi:twitching motility protein PilT